MPVSSAPPPATNDLAAHQRLLDTIEPWSGDVPDGYLVDFVGALTDVEFRLDWGATREMARARHVVTTPPTFGDGGNGEIWLEMVDWIEVAKAATREPFVAVTLGACYGAQAVGAYKALQRVRPMRAKLVFVEPEPSNFQWIERHLRDNGLDPDDHWLIRAAIDDKGEPVFFPVGAPGAGAQAILGRERAIRRFARFGRARRSLRNILRNNTTGLVRPLASRTHWQVEFKLLSAVTLREVLGPLDFVDFLEADIQGAEEKVFPPFMNLLNRKVRRIHIGTHGAAVHQALHETFEREGWLIVFSFGPNQSFESELGPFVTNDGVLTVVNPRL